MAKRLTFILIIFLSSGACSPPRHATMDPPPSIVQAGELGLRTPARTVTSAEIQTDAFQMLIARMIRTMRQAPGVGLAAPQIGVPLRVIVLEDTAQLAARLTDLERNERERVPFPVRVFVNPTLRPIGEEHATFFEGCLSVNGYVGLVERSRVVEVTGLDEHGQSQTWRVSGWPARILQHEVDHIDGRLYIDRMITRSFTSAAQAKTLYAGKPIGEIRKMLGL